MKTSIGPLLLVILMLWTPSAMTQEIVLPVGKTLTVEGIEYKAFTIAEYGEIAKLERDYVAVLDQNVLLKQNLQIAGWELTKRAGQLRTCLGGLDVLEEENDFLTVSLKSEHALRLKLDLRKSIREKIAWGLVIVELIGLGVLGIAYGVK